MLPEFLAGGFVEGEHAFHAGEFLALEVGDVDVVGGDVVGDEDLAIGDGRAGVAAGDGSAPERPWGRRLGSSATMPSSRQTLSRWGPIHCGQSAAKALAASTLVSITAETVFIVQTPFESKGWEPAANSSKSDRFLGQYRPSVDDRARRFSRRSKSRRQSTETANRRLP